MVEGGAAESKVTVLETLRGERMFRASMSSGHITALTDGEVVHATALLLRGLALLGLMGSASPAFLRKIDDLGGPTVWGVALVLLTVPQIAGWVMAWYGRMPHHTARMVLICGTVGAHAAVLVIWVSIDAWTQVGFQSLFMFLGIRSVSRVWAYNGARAVRL